MRRGYANAASGASTERHSCGKFMQAVSKAALRRAAALQAHEKSQQRFIHKHTVLGSFLARASASAHRCGRKQAQQTRQQHHPPLRQRRNRLHCTRCLCKACNYRHIGIDVAHAARGALPCTSTCPTHKAVTRIGCGCASAAATCRHGRRRTYRRASRRR